MRGRVRAIVLLTVVCAVMVFAVVQDRVTADGARRYAALQRRAIAGEGSAVTIDQVVQPAVERSVRQGLLWAGMVLAGGLGIAGMVARRLTRE